jgi:hypothetical protein
VSNRCANDADQRSQTQTHSFSKIYRLARIFNPSRWASSTNEAIQQKEKLFLHFPPRLTSRDVASRCLWTTQLVRLAPHQEIRNKYFPCGSMPVLFCLGIQPNCLNIVSYSESGLLQAKWFRFVFACVLPLAESLSIFGNHFPAVIIGLFETLDFGGK